MSGRIPKAFIDEVLARTDIVELIDARLPLKKAGRNRVACCPFHSEKTPSFTVSPAKQFYHCFGCGAHGTALGFLMEYERLSFPEAVETLAALLGMEIPRESGMHSDDQSYKAVYRILQDAALFYKQQLKKNPAAIDYLKNRGISGQIAADYMLGYAAPGWDNLLQALGKDSGSLTLLQNAGLIIENEQGRQYDRFRQRIIFPIRDARGRVVAFGGRVLDNQEKPKYLNSPETSVYHKGRELYGLHELRLAEPKIEQILVVEGYMDVVALAQQGIRHAVATLGTATTPEQLGKLLRTCRRLIFCFDGDSAGQQAAWRALETTMPLLRSGHDIRFLFLPQSEDPDSLIKKEGRDQFLARYPQAQTLSDYLFAHLQQQTELRSLDGRARLADLAKPLLQSMQDSLFQQLLVERLAQLVGLSPDKVWNTPAHLQTKPISRAQSKQLKLEITDLRLAIAALLEQPALAQTVLEMNMLKNLQQPGTELLLELLQLIQTTPNIKTAAILQRYSESSHAKALHKLAAYEFVLDNENNNSIAQVFHDAIKQLLHKAKQQRFAALIQKPLTELSASEREELKNIRRI